ncbi:hypothetical protein [Acinetobacter pittii]|uniref:hypothetical protein n=1 Tax=Acinetobacter pittii TaxID=48296 RepID=UPI000A3C3FC2|nr:hypothetical protein [Acinetobacter pittii]MCZ1177490.1 hypothetical protein [Acinetobacter pittii]OTU23306.1 hypothetical protein CAT62_03145 [Acinetobacter pittii]OTU50909.1 hypothetical protein CAT36_13355 [Acinetobacter pittii]QDB81779.1 hypothetical protein APMS7_04965 [Acinetobacter pittii]QRF08334.1 hypothetical protein HRJ47_10185 [Acinetobacter pittii]
MLNNFNAEQARQNAKNFKINQDVILEKILTGTESESKEGKRKTTFWFPVDVISPDHLTLVEEELRSRGFNVSTDIEHSGTTITIEISF